MPSLTATIDNFVNRVLFRAVQTI